MFQAIGKSGLKLFSGAAIGIALPDAGQVKIAALAETDHGYAEAWRARFSPFPLTREYMHGKAKLDRRMLDIPDVEDAPPEFAAGKSNFLASGYRVITIMPLTRGDDAIGALSLIRRAPGALSEKQLEPHQNSPHQAVIANENKRMLNELRQRTDDQTESLEYQTATGEILGVISKSPTNVQPVFDIIAASAVRLCGATWSGVLQYNGDLIKLGALHNTHDFEGAEALPQYFPRKPSARGATDRAVSSRATCYIRDVQEVAPSPKNRSSWCRISPTRP